MARYTAERVLALTETTPAFEEFVDTNEDATQAAEILIYLNSARAVAKKLIDAPKLLTLIHAPKLLTERPSFDHAEFIDFQWRIAGLDTRDEAFSKASLHFGLKVQKL